MNRVPPPAPALARSSEILAEIVDSAPIAILLCGADGRILLANREAAGLFGYAPGELIGKPVEQLVPPPLQAAHPALRDAFLAAPVERPMGRGRDLRALRRDGTLIPVEVALTPIRDPRTDETCVLAVALDLRERLRMQNDLRAANDTLERRVADRTAELQATLESNIELVRDLQQKRAALERLSREDALTGLHNRRGFDLRLAEEIERASRLRQPLTVAMFDLDHFKRVNDHCGHAAGDAVPRQIGLLLRQQCRTIDLIARYGGEEFVVGFPSTPVDAAAAVGERIRIAVERSDWTHVIPRCPYAVTVSAGVAEWRPGMSAHALLAAADANLYAAKRKGRNQVVPAPIEI